LSKEICGFRPEFKGDGLDDKTEKYSDPDPVGSPEARRIEKWNRSKESAAEGNQCGESKFPFSTKGVDENFAFHLRFTERKDQCLPSLDKHQEYQKTP